MTDNEFDLKTATIKQIHRHSWKLFKLAGNEKYYKINKTYKYLPTITGCPTISNQSFRPFVARDKLTSKPQIKLKFMPKYCHLRKIVNYPYSKLGAPLVCITGNYGTGKSVIKNNIKAFQLARGVRILEFNDRRFEARNLACHGYYDKDQKFHPFEIHLMVPDNYRFKKFNPLWKYYDNVKMKFWKTPDDILEEMKSHRMVVVYEECFTDEAKLKLWIDLMEGLGENMDYNVVNMFSHHELARLIPETPTGNIHALVREASNVAMNLRKDRIGMITTFHMLTEVFFRISQKFGFTIVKRPVNRRHMSQVEYDALGFALDEVNISRGGYWMKHKIGYFPELPDIFRLIPQKEKLSYPEMDIVSPVDITKRPKDDYNTIISNMYTNGFSIREIAKYLPLGKSAIGERVKKLGLATA